MLNILLAGAADQPTSLFDNQQGFLFVTMGIMIAVFYFFTIRPQRKQEKESQEMRSSIEVGDEIVTIGGIVGTVVSLQDNTILLETAGERSKIRILRGAVQSNNTARESMEREKKATKEKKDKK